MDTEPIWKAFADKNAGTYELLHGEHVVRLTLSGHTLVLSSYTHFVTLTTNTYDTDYTRGQVSFISRDNYKLLITREGLIEKIGKFFGMQDIQIKDEVFDKDFIVKSNDEERTIKLFADKQIASKMESCNLLRFEITPDDGLFGEKPENGHSMIYCILDKRITSQDELDRLKSLLAEMLDCMHKS